MVCHTRFSFGFCSRSLVLAGELESINLYLVLVIPREGLRMSSSLPLLALTVQPQISVLKVGPRVPHPLGTKVPFLTRPSVLCGRADLHPVYLLCMAINLHRDRKCQCKTKNKQKQTSEWREPTDVA